VERIKARRELSETSISTLASELGIRADRLARFESGRVEDEDLPELLRALVWASEFDASASTRTANQFTTERRRARRRRMPDICKGDFYLVLRRKRGWTWLQARLTSKPPSLDAGVGAQRPRGRPDRAEAAQSKTDAAV
jgi:transcriptional regulator with XRE-family HTH domain